MTRKELKVAGYFFHKGGDMYPEINNPKKRGIWRGYENGVKRYIGVSLLDAEDDHNKTEVS